MTTYTLSESELSPAFFAHLDDQWKPCVIAVIDHNDLSDWVSGPAFMKGRPDALGIPGCAFFGDIKHGGESFLQRAALENLKTSAECELGAYAFFRFRKEAVVVGYDGPRDFTSHKFPVREVALRARLLSRPERLPATHVDSSWATYSYLIADTTSWLANNNFSSIQELFDALTRRLFTWLAYENNHLHVTIWRADFRQETVNCVAQCGSTTSTIGKSFELGKGLVGWSALHWKTIVDSGLNVLVHSENLLSGSTQNVRDVYHACSDTKAKLKTQTELILPLVYRNRLIGVIAVESPIRERFSEQLVLAAQMLATHFAQAIHEAEMRECYDLILSEEDPDELGQRIAEQAGHFMGSKYASVFLWDSQKLGLTLAGTTCATTKLNSGEPVEKGDLCYVDPCLGLTRWCFENDMWLYAENVQELDKPDSDEWVKLINQIRKQLSKRWGVRVETVQLKGSADLPNRRDELLDGATAPPVWEFHTTTDGRTETAAIRQPVWSNSHREDNNPARSTIVVPISRMARILPSGGDHDRRVSIGDAEFPQDPPSLGVMRFTRVRPSARDDSDGTEDSLLHRPFSDFDQSVLADIARHVATSIHLKNDKETRAAERTLLKRIVNPPHVENWEQGFQNRLREILTEIRQVSNADVVLLRLRNHNELILVATDGTGTTAEKERELTAIIDRPVMIPRVVYEGRGASGRAASTGRSVVVTDSKRPILSEAAEEFVDEEHAFVVSTQSEVAIPLIVRKETASVNVDETVVGTITAISFQPMKLSFHRKQVTDNEFWTVERTGVYRETVWLLRNHAAWLAHLVQVVQELVSWQRNMASLVASVPELAIAARSSRGSVNQDPSADYEESRRFVEIIGRLAAHHDKLGFEQVMLARVVSSGAGTDVRLASVPFGIWGAVSIDDQRRLLAETESDPVVTDPGFMERWNQFSCPIPEVPATPILILGTADETPDSRRGITCHPASQWTELRESIRALYESNDTEKVVGGGSFLDLLEVGIIPVSPGSSGSRPEMVLLVTAQRFQQDPEPASKQKIASHPLNADRISTLHHLAQIASLAHQASERGRLLDAEAGFSRLFHEINAPLALIRSLSDLPPEDLSDMDRQRLIFCHKQLQELRDCYDILVHPESYEEPSNWKRSEVSHFVADLRASSKAIGDFYGVDVGPPDDTSGDQLQGLLYGDARIIAIACQILVSNAIKAVRYVAKGDIPPEGFKPEISVTFSIESGQLRIDVWDNGVACTLTKEEMFSLHKSSWNGLGIGLHTTNVICQLFNGQLKWDGEKTFSVLFPIGSM